MPATRWWCVATVILLLAGSARIPADGLSFAYEGDVLPYDPSAGWIIANSCEYPPCTETVQNGYFGLVFSHPPPGDAANYHLWIAQQPVEPPPTLWVEWRYRSNHPLGPNYYNCDGKFTVLYREVLELVNTYGDAAISFSGDDWAYPLALDYFHSYRFESFDGVGFRIAVDGVVFMEGTDALATGANYLQFGSFAAAVCHDWVDLPFVRNEWDFVRYGTIAFGERIVESDPPMGFLDPGSPQNLALDRFTVTYDSPAYAYIDDITVGVTCDAGPPCAQAPQVIATKRLDNGPPDVLEIVLDRPLPAGERTTFTFIDVDPSDPDHPTVNTVAYTFQRGDVNADGRWDLRDFASMQNCYFTLATTNTCAAFDYDMSIFIDLSDHAAFAADVATQGP